MSIEPYLGDVIGEPPLPARRAIIPRRRRFAGAARAIGDLLGILGYAILVVGAVVGFFTSFASYNAARGQYQVPPACAALASRAGLPMTLTQEQRDWALAEIEKNLSDPEVRLCKEAILIARRARDRSRAF